MAMMHGCKLASDIIRTHFGELVEKVCQCLLYRGPLYLAEIARFTNMNPGQLRNALLVLVQHNCVQGYKMDQEGGAKVHTSYIALVDNILHRMRFPKFLVVVRDELGVEAESLLEGLLEHGRLTLEQIIQRAAARQGKGEADVETLQKQTFASLIRACYIERCPASEPILVSKAAEPEKNAQRGPKSKSKKEALKKIVAEEVRVVAAAAPPDTERFRVPVCLEGGGETATEETMSDASGFGQKRKRDALTMDSKTLAVVDEKEVLWRVNYEEVIRKLRHQACVAQAQTRVDTAAGIVLEAMLESSRAQERKPRQQSSIPMSLDAIMEAVARTPAGRTMTLERTRGALHHMAAESMGFLTRSGEGGSNYAVNMQKVIESAQRREVEAIVLRRFGRDSCRIYRLLMMKGQMEQKQIAGMAMLQGKEAHVLLYNLLKENYVVVQEVAKTAEHAAQKSLYLWSVSWQTMKYHILDDMYHAAANLGQRLAHDLQQEQEVLDLLKQIQAAKAAGSESHVTLTQRQHEQLKRIRRVATVLETSLLHLDDALLMFRDF